MRLITFIATGVATGIMTIDLLTRAASGYTFTLNMLDAIAFLLLAIVLTLINIDHKA